MAKSSKKLLRFVEASGEGAGKSNLRLQGASVAGTGMEQGRALRDVSPRSDHETIGTLPATRDPVALILASNKDRVEALLPVRHSRMLESPFTFYRGTAGLQAFDLGFAPSSNIVVQCCGDAHLMNFGGFATPERRFVFDLNDFDETYPAPFEWDLKRLVPSLVLAARWRGFPEETGRDIAEAAARAYRERIAASAEEATLDAWYAAVTWEGIRDQVAGDKKSAKAVDRIIAKAQDRTAENVFHKLTTSDGGDPRLLDQPPLLYHPPDIDLRKVAKPFLDAYAASLRADYQSLFARLRFVDAALKVVGVGSVGTRCFVALMLGEQNEPVFLQIKEARASVLDRSRGKASRGHQGERVVAGQQLMQSASDIFLGWARGPNQRDFYVRQLRDMKASVEIETWAPKGLMQYGVLCAQTLARAHAKAGAAARIAGYLGKSRAFDKAMRRYAADYADQAEKDFAEFRNAAANGRVKTEASASETELMIA
jgi:uncharacterized protein (DUF2252 family)